MRPQDSAPFEIPAGLPSIVELARSMWGDPTRVTPDEVEFGSRGSKKVRPHANTWFDHEAATGGGYLQLYRLKHGDLPPFSRGSFRVPAGMRQELGEPTAWWDYQDEGGTVVARVVRFDPPSGKTYRQCRPNGGDRWAWKMGKLQIPLYNLPEIVAAPDNATIHIVEGEKHVDLLRSWGLLATTNAQGASKFRAHHAATLARFQCVILPDNDDAGQAHAEVVTAELRRAGCQSIHILNLPGLPPKGDVMDWAEAGGTREAFLQLAASVTVPAEERASERELEAPDEAAEPPAEVARARAKRRRVRDEADENDLSVDGPVIRVIAGELHNTATAGEAAIISAGLPIYQRGDTLVRPISREVSASRGRTTIAAGLGDLGVHGLIDVLCGCARWERYDVRAEDWLRINPPVPVAQVILARYGQWRLPPIAGVVTTPTLRPDGSILSAPGYDPATRLYHVADPKLQIHPTVHKPTRLAADGALKALAALLAEFPFTSDVAKAVALSATITPVVRGALAVAPLHLFRANTAGSGKSYLSDVTSAIATGRPCPVISAAPDDGETEKRLAGLLLAGYPLISIDNVNGELGGDLLCQAIERPLIRLRRLGASDIIEIESNATIFATGNNARVKGDMVRRSLIADLDAQQERPELRTFKADPVAAVLADRGRYVSACLVIVRAYIQAGLPNPPASLASFSEWSTLVRGALVWLGCADPVISMETAREDDPELTELREVLTEWDAAFGGDALALRDVITAADARLPTQMGEPTDYALPNLRDVLHRLFGERGSINSRRFGNWLSAKEGRIVAGKRFRRASTMTREGTVRWRVETVRHG